MVNYRCARIPGATYFSTVTLRDRRKEWLIAYVDQLRTVVRVTRRQRPFTLEAIVVLPEHLHALWTLRCALTGDGFAECLSPAEIEVPSGRSVMPTLIRDLKQTASRPPTHRNSGATTATLPYGPADSPRRYLSA